MVPFSYHLATLQSQLKQGTATRNNSFEGGICGPHRAGFVALESKIPTSPFSSGGCNTLDERKPLRHGMYPATACKNAKTCLHCSQVPIVDKVLKAQAAGAKGVIVIDDGGCDEGFIECGRLGGVRDGGFAKRDGAHTWSSVRVPAVLLSAAQGTRLKALMRLEKINLEGLGEQLVQR